MAQKYRVLIHFEDITNTWVIRYRGKNYSAEKLTCYTSTESIDNPKKPRRILRGYARTVDIIGNKAFIT